MPEATRTHASNVPQRPASPAVWPGYAAGCWALLFAAANLYWALGGRLAFPLQDDDSLLADPAFVAANDVAIALKVLMAGVAFATVRP